MASNPSPFPSAVAAGAASPFHAIASRLRARSTLGKPGTLAGPSVGDAIADLRDDVGELASYVGYSLAGKGTRAPFGLARATASAVILANAVQTPGMARAFLCGTATQPGSLTAINVGNRPLPIGAAALDLSAIDPTQGNSDAGYPLGDINTNEPITVNGTLDVAGTWTLWIESR